MHKHALILLNETDTMPPSGTQRHENVYLQDSPIYLYDEQYFTCTVCYRFTVVIDENT